MYRKKKILITGRITYEKSKETVVKEEKIKDAIKKRLNTNFLDQI